ncbi:MAG TPA: molecular chaperone DnaJ [Fimbriimonas sp.]|nr:molecular chaperone DnaJ [Fimbriimonas sp.]
MANRDPYEVLGVSRSAGADEIKSAYRRLARRYHPDVNPNDPTAEEHFKEVGEAYSILSDPDKKDRFDRFGTVDQQQMQGDVFGGFSDLFDVFFGAGQQGGRRSRGRDGSDLRYDLQLTMLDVVNGAQREIEVERMAECDSCHGSGVEGGKKPETCPTCKGQGVVSAVRNTFLGQVRTQTTCSTCQGTGTLIKDPCKVCRGAGVTPRTEKVTLTVPPGFETGATMHLPGQGNDGSGGGRPGDLYVVLHVQDDKRFERRGQTLFTNLDLTFAQAALGDQLEIEGIEGPIEVSIPAGTQPGTRIPVKGAGLPPLHGGRRGDLMVLATVKIPERLSEAEAKLVRDFAELRGEDVPKGAERGGILGGLFGKKR